MNLDYSIDSVLKKIDFSKNQFQDIGNGILLTNHEIEVLNQYNISYRQCKSLKDILFQIEEVLQYMDIMDDELDYVASSISERDYYQNTNK